MSELILKLTPPVRPEREYAVSVPEGLGDVEKPLSALERLANNTLARRGLILVLLGVVWEAYGRWLGSPLTFPTFLDTLEALANGIASGVIPDRLFVTLQTLVMGYAIGLVIAALFTSLAVTP